MQEVVGYYYALKQSNMFAQLNRKGRQVFHLFMCSNLAAAAAATSSLSQSLLWVPEMWGALFQGHQVAVMI